MRVSDLQRFQSFSIDVEKRLSNLTRIQQEIGRGQRLFQPSEDVPMANQALQARALIAENAQYIRNVDDGKNFVSAAADQIQRIVELINDIDALALAADNDTQSPDDRLNSASEVNQKLEALVELVNTSHGDRYLFGGFNTTSPPFIIIRDESGSIDAATANEESISGQIYRRVGQNEDIRINVSGDRLFQPIGSANSSEDLFHVIASLRNTIANNNTPPEGEEESLANHALRENLEGIRNRIIGEQTYLGAVAQRLEARKSNLLEIEIQLTDSHDQAQGIDMTDLVSRLALEEGVYSSLMAINSRILTKSLVDFLR